MSTTALCIATAFTTNVSNDQQHKEQNGATCGKPTATLLTTCIVGHKMGYKPCPGQQIVGDETEANCSRNDREKLCNQCASAHHLAHHQDTRHAACRTSHQQHQCRTRGESLHHQCHSYWYAAGGTQIHGDGYTQHQQH